MSFFRYLLKGKVLNKFLAILFITLGVSYAQSGYNKYNTFIKGTRISQDDIVELETILSYVINIHPNGPTAAETKKKISNELKKLINFYKTQPAISNEDVMHFLGNISKQNNLTAANMIEVICYQAKCSKNNVKLFFAMLLSKMKFLHHYNKRAKCSMTNREIDFSLINRTNKSSAKYTNFIRIDLPSFYSTDEVFKILSKINNSIDNERNFTIITLANGLSEYSYTDIQHPFITISQKKHQDMESKQAYYAQKFLNGKIRYCIYIPIEAEYLDDDMTAQILSTNILYKMYSNYSN